MKVCTRRRMDQKNVGDANVCKERWNVAGLNLSTASSEDLQSPTFAKYAEFAKQDNK